jgi:hypothetical protein
MGQWVNGSMGQWVNGSMGQWVNGPSGTSGTMFGVNNFSFQSTNKQDAKLSYDYDPYFLLHYFQA